jgi:hypothetical protein
MSIGKSRGEGRKYRCTYRHTQQQQQQQQQHRLDNWKRESSICEPLSTTYSQLKNNNNNNNNIELLIVS